MLITREEARMIAEEFLRVWKEDEERGKREAELAQELIDLRHWQRFSYDWFSHARKETVKEGTAGELEALRALKKERQAYDATCPHSFF